MRHPSHLILVAFAAVFVARGTPSRAADGGTLTGTVRVAGTMPARPPLPVYKSHQVCGQTIADERVVIGPGGGLRYAVVTIEGVRGGREPERDVVPVLDNRLCRFDPHVQTAEVGQSLELRNSDPILHNADARIAQVTLFNVALPPGREVRKPLAQAGTITVTCDVRHTWMKAFIAVADHPYHTVTDAEGVYEIRNVPAGSYTVRVWHEELGTVEHQVVIEPRAVATLDVAYSSPKAPETPQ